MDTIRKYYENAGLNLNDIERKLSIFEKHPDITEEFKNWIEANEYSIDGIKIEGYSAQQLAGLSPLLEGEGAFLMMIELREHPKKAINRIERGFKLK